MRLPLRQLNNSRTTVSPWEVQPGSVRVQPPLCGGGDRQTSPIQHDVLSRRPTPQPLRFKITANGWVSRAKPNGKGSLGLGHIARLLQEQTPTARAVQKWWATYPDGEDEIIASNGNPCPATPIERDEEADTGGKS